MEKAGDDCKPIKGSHIHILGVAYKKNIDDVRESPALDIMLLLKGRGARLTYSDPYVSLLRMEGEQLASTDVDMAAKADCTVVVTDHSVFNYRQIAEQAKLIVDTRNAFKGITFGRIVRL